MQMCIRDRGILSGSLKKTGTIQEMKSLVSELIQYDISPQQVQKMQERAGENPLLSTKLQDVGLIYQAFEEYLKDRYITCLLYTSLFLHVSPV